MTAPASFRIARSRFARYGAGFLTVFAVCCAVIVFWAFTDNRDALPVWAALLAVMLVPVGPVGLWCLGIAIARPIGLRLDPDGISGYFLVPMIWADVKAVSLYEQTRVLHHGDGDVEIADQGYPYLALRLHDPQVWHSRASAVQRLFQRAQPRTRAWHVLMPLDDLRPADPRAVTHLACRFHEGL